MARQRIVSTSNNEKHRNQSVIEWLHKETMLCGFCSWYISPGVSLVHAHIHRTCRGVEGSGAIAVRTVSKMIRLQVARYLFLIVLVVWLVAPQVKGAAAKCGVRHMCRHKLKQVGTVSYLSS